MALNSSICSGVVATNNFNCFFSFLTFFYSIIAIWKVLMLLTSLILESMKQILMNWSNFRLAVVMDLNILKLKSQDESRREITYFAGYFCSVI